MAGAEAPFDIYVCTSLRLWTCCGHAAGFRCLSAGQVLMAGLAGWLAGWQAGRQAGRQADRQAGSHHSAESKSLQIDERLIPVTFDLINLFFISTLFSIVAY